MNISLKTFNDIPICIVVTDNDDIKQYMFQEITREQLMKLRLIGEPGLVYKSEDKFYYTAFPGTLRIIGGESTLGPHLCGRNCTNVCKNCPRTSALTVAYQERSGKRFTQAVKDSWRIEKYPFITEGIEAFNMESSNDAFLVLSCSQYALSPARQVKQPQPGKKAILDLANFIWPDFDGSYEDLRNLIYSCKSRQ